MGDVHGDVESAVGAVVTVRAGGEGIHAARLRPEGELVLRREPVRYGLRVGDVLVARAGREDRDQDPACAALLTCDLDLVPGCERELPPFGVDEAALADRLLPRTGGLGCGVRRQLRAGRDRGAAGDVPSARRLAR